MSSLAMKLLQATEAGLLPKVRDLIAQGATVEERDVCCFTPLIRAAYDNSLEIAELLLDAGADIHASCEEGWTAVAYALQNGHFQMAQMLATRGANVDYLDFEIGEDLPLHRKPMEELIRSSAGLSVWREWEAYRLNAAPSNALGVPTRPRL